MHRENELSILFNPIANAHSCDGLFQSSGKATKYCAGLPSALEQCFRIIMDSCVLARLRVALEWDTGRITVTSGGRKWWQHPNGIHALKVLCPSHWVACASRFKHSLPAACCAMKVHSNTLFDSKIEPVLRTYSAHGNEVIDMLLACGSPSTFSLLLLEHEERLELTLFDVPSDCM